MKEIFVFSDGSVNVQSKIGFGASLILDDFESTIETMKKQVKVKRFENTSSTKLELQTLLWVLNELQYENQKIIIYTDSQNIVGLPGRRERLEKNNYRSKKKEYINNYQLYQEFYRFCDVLNCEFIKVIGHQQTKSKDTIHQIFTLVDRASRSALREEKT